ncbi:putative metalloprotease CJM1_0395 family protein [Roseibium sp. MMSF_3412]|uniref:putative metalloprotease CJM1_0395 family protein n=1 Tax=Roseibium sp. MMSF_3412 TaxID=3046712 RepID=UPI00273F3A42|nr:putative metalloprotease CJM1_0395 family protein [Roseibium sp. MMSF_3412]
MIGALLSNTPASLLRGNGVAGELEPGLGTGVSGREREAARDSLASAPVQSARRNSGPILSPQAVLALQDTEQAGAQGRGSTGPQAETADDEAASSAGQQRPAGGTGAAAAEQGGANPAQGQAGASEKDDPDGDGLNEAEEKQVQELAKRDREVRAHEQAHARVGGPYAGAPSYTFQQGPDGKRYAIGGEVQIDTSKEKTPQETIRKMQIVIRAALAPAEPSSQDLKVAQLARSQLSEAQAEARQAKADELQGTDEGGDAASGPGADANAVTEDPSSDGANSDKTGAGNQNGEAASAYQSARQRASDAEALLASIIA